MVFDRITLVKIYDFLKLVQDNDGDVKNILLNKTSKYGTKTVPRFTSLNELKLFISQKYPYRVPDECTCLTHNEALWKLLAFEIYSRREDLLGDIIDENNKRKQIVIQPSSKYATFVNNIGGSYSSNKAAFQNKLSINAAGDVFKDDLKLKELFDSYACRAYINQQGNYIRPCDYIQILKNEQYDNLIELYYTPTKTKDI